MRVGSLAALRYAVLFCLTGRLFVGGTRPTAWLFAGDLSGCVPDRFRGGIQIQASTARQDSARRAIVGTDARGVDVVGEPEIWRAIQGVVEQKRDVVWCG